MSEPALLVAIVQPNYLPWRGYFDLINFVDVFVFLDDVQYTKRDWRNRNKFLVRAGGSIWLSVPVKASRETLINEAEIDHSLGWADKHISMLRHNYSKSPYYGEYAGTIADLLHTNFETIADLDIALTSQVCDWLGIKTELRRASEYGCSGIKDERLIDLVKRVGGTRYLSGPSARNYIQSSLWDEAGIDLDFFTYPEYPPYPQISKKFEPQVSVLDLLFMMGPGSSNYIWGWSQ